MQYPPHLSSDQHLVRLTYIGVLSTAEPVGEFSTWLLTGTAAILGLIIANISSISPAIWGIGLSWGLALLTISIVAGVIAKQLGIAIRNAVALTEALYTELQTQEGAATLQTAGTDSETLAIELAKPFIWPFKSMMENATLMGAKDPLSGEKRLIKYFCIQLYASYLQGGLAALGLLFLAFGIK
jgi:hypothetical protein